MNHSSAHGYADNELIAEFMGKTLTLERYVGNERSDHKISYDGYYQEWNNLMPVVEKIELLQFEVAISSIIETRDDDRTLIWFHDCEIRDGVINMATVSNNKLEAVYKAVIKFIKWHNQQSK